MKESFRGAWGKIGTYDLEHVTDLIVTGRTPSEAKPDEWLYEWLGHYADKPITILDFGCGMGRNTFGLATKFPNWNVYGYDSEGMIEKSKAYCDIHYNGVKPANLTFESDWEKVKAIHFDVVICIIVLQHIFEADLANYAKDFKGMTDFLLVAGRRYNDDTKHRSTWAILQENGLTPYKFFKGHIEIPFETEGTPEEHNIAFYKP